MNDTTEPEFDISELESLSGVTRRTIRYYVQRGILVAPSGTGRGKHYDRTHLDRLIEVRTRQEAGESLDAIAATPTLSDFLESARSEPGPSEAPDSSAVASGPTAWFRLSLAPGLELHAQAGVVDTVTLRRIAQVVRSMLTSSTADTATSSRDDSSQES